VSNEDKTPDDSTPAVLVAAPKLSKVEEIQARREAKREALEAQKEEQRAIDLEALEALEDEHGINNIVWMDLPYTPGLVSLVAAKCPTPAYMKRYRDMCKTKNEKHPDYIAAAEMLAAVCRVYPPEQDDYKKVLDARPGVHVQLGVAAMKLGSGREQDESKS